MRIAKNFSYVLAVAFLMFGIAVSVFAQSNTSTYITNPSAVRDGDINVDFIPTVPGPNQNVKINLSSYVTDINKATITWSLNGKTALAGIGKTSFSFTTGDIGSTSEVSIMILVIEGSRVDKKITIQPSQVDLLWESPSAYVPAFYKGKALNIKESQVKVVAMPIDSDGTVTPGTKVYTWKKNFVVDQPSSGYGKYSFLVKNSYLDPSDSVAVNVSGTNGSGSAGNLNINYVDPKILVYENSPTYGLRLNKLLNVGFPLKNSEISVSAEPFYFSKYKNSIVEKNMTYRWTINGTIVNPPARPNELTIRGSDEPGTANVSISITNINTLFQEAKQSLSISLGK